MIDNMRNLISYLDSVWEYIQQLRFIYNEYLYYMIKGTEIVY